jgi:hypothetical protein
MLATPPAAPAPEGADHALWRIVYPGTLLGVAGSAVVFGRYERELVTFDVETGRKRATLGRWRSQVGKGANLADPFLLGPLIGGTLGSSNAGLAFVDPSADRVRLRSRLFENAYVTPPGPSHGPIAVAGRDASGTDIAILGASVGTGACLVELRAVDLRSGRRLWRWAPDTGCAALYVAVASSRVIVFSPGWLHVFDLTTGSPLWQQPSSICDDATCDGLSDFRIAADSRHVAMKVANRMAVHSASTGDPLWSGESEIPFSTQFLVSDGQMYVANRVAIDCLDASGRALWRLPLAGTGAQQIELAGDSLYVADAGVVRAVDRATGALRWAFGGDRFALAGGPNASGPAATVIIGEDGEGAVAYTVQRPPSSLREITVMGQVTVHTHASRGMPVQRVSVFVGGTIVHPSADGRYEARVRLSGGRLAISATTACRGAVGPIYLRLDGRSEYQKDLVLDDHCGD